MTLDLEQLKKDHKTSYFAEEYERLLSEEKKVNDMVSEDESLRDLADEEIQNINFCRNHRGDCRICFKPVYSDYQTHLHEFLRDCEWRLVSYCSCPLLLDN